MRIAWEDRLGITESGWIGEGTDRAERLPLLLLKLMPRRVSEWQAGRLACAARLVVSRLNHHEILQDRPTEVGPLCTEISRIGELLEAHRKAPLKSDSGDSLAAGLAAELDERCMIVAAEDKALRDVLYRAKRLGRGNVSLKLGRAERRIREGADASGAERREAYTDALMILRELSETEDGAQEGAVWLLLGFLRMKLGPDYAEATRSLYQASLQFAQRKDVLTALTLRLLAWAQGPYQGYAAALATAQRAMAFSRDPGLILEAVQYAELANEPAEAARLLELGTHLHGTLAIEALALSEPLNSDEDLLPQRLQSIFKALKENASKVGQAMEVLQEANRYANTIREAAGLPMEPTPSLPEGSSGLLGAGLRVLWATDEARRVRDRAMRALEEVVADQHEIVKQEREALRAEQRKGEERISRLSGKALEAEKRLKAELEKFDAQESAAEQSAVLGVKLGAGMLAVLFLANVAMSSGGRTGFLHGPVLLVALLVAAAPAAAAIGLQMMRAGARVALEQDLRVTVQRARDEERRAREKVEKENDAALTAIRERLTFAENRHRELEAVWHSFQPQVEAA